MPQLKIIRTLICLVFVLFVYRGVSGQSGRPKIGLVLSGGGAKGIAHIGVLKALEEAGIVPDYITGTSMGSIVGGLYATGYSADELREIVLRTDWSQLLSNKVPFNQITFEEKNYYGRYLASVYMKNKKLLLPKGIIEGQELTHLFSDLTRNVHGVTNFKDLPIPFACVASDIVTGKAVVLSEGSLAMAMRASMSIPSVFTPVRIGDHLLVDGGLVRNMPVDEALAMGADIIIGVYVSTDLDPEEKLTSALSIIEQSSFLYSAIDTREQLAKCSILVKPDIDGLSTGSFNLAPLILERGDQAGKAYLEQFRKLADSLKRWPARPPVIRPNMDSTYQFSNVEVEGVDKARAEFILGKLGITAGQSVSLHELDERLDIIYGTQYFEKIWFEVLGTAGNRILKIHVVEHPATQFKFSYHYDSENKGGILLNATWRNMLLKRSRFIVEADLASYPGITIDYFKYLGQNQHLAFQLTGNYSRNELPIYDSLGNLFSLFSIDQTRATARLQTARFLNGAFGVEVEWAHVGLKPKVADEDLRVISKITYHQTLFAVYHRFDNTDDRYFPTRGLRSEIKVSSTTKANAKVRVGDLTLGPEYLGDLIFTSNIVSVDASIFPAIPISPRLTILAKAKLKVSNLSDNSLNLASYDFIGGFFPTLSNAQEYFGAGTKEFMMANYFYGRLGLQFAVMDNLFAQAHINYLDVEYPVRWLYADADTGMFGDRERRIAYAVSVGYSSPIGPISIAVARDQFRSDWKASLSIGFHY